MRVFRTVGACALALAACSISAATAAATEYPLTRLPEVGRCVKVENGTGKFNLSNCIGVDKDHEDGSYDWRPGPAEHGTFKARLNSTVVETVGGGKISCALMFLTGEVTSGDTVKVTETVLEGCTNVKPKKNCFSNELEAGKIVSHQVLIGEVGFVPNLRNPAAPTVGINLEAEPASLPLLSFSCGVELGAEAVALEGSVIGKIAKPGKMIVSNGLIFSQKAGHQKPEAFKGGEKDTITETVTPISNPLGKTSEQAGLNAAGELEFGEALEFKSKQH